MNLYDYISLVNKENIQEKVYHKVNKGFWIYSFSYLEINELHKKRYLLQNNAVEIFLKNGKNFFLAFNINLSDKIVEKIMKNIKNSHIHKNNNYVINTSIIKNEENSEKDDLGVDSFGTELTNSDSLFEIKNFSSSSIKNDNMIFILNHNLFIEKNKKNISFLYNQDNNYSFDKRVKNKLRNSQAAILDPKEIIDIALDKWSNDYLDNFSYIMILNTISGRTYNDFGQYPVFPWILQDYTSKKLNLENEDTYRDFKYPIYAQTENSRNHLKQKYENFEEDEDEKYHCGTHYSNSGFVSYYLIRTKPFAVLAAELQGDSFDTPDRLFSNVYSSYKVEEKYQELIPEFFILPEIFINFNNFNFGVTSENKVVEDVVLPPWASHSPRYFTKLLKKIFENFYISKHITDWIDLIFGYKQNGIEAEKVFNILRKVCSSFNPENYCKEEYELELVINEINEMGMSPMQLFSKQHHKKEKHQSIKAFFGRSVYLSHFNPSENKYKIHNFQRITSIKEIYKYYECKLGNLSLEEGGLSSFRMCYEEDNNEKKKTEDDIYFIVGGNKSLLPPSYKNFIEWGEKNIFYIIKPFKRIKYEFIIQHMRKYYIKCIKATKDGKYLIIGYNNAIWKNIS